MAGPFPAQGSPHLSRLAGADLSAKQFYFVKLSAGALVLCDTQGEQMAGVLLDAPVSGEPAAYAMTPGYRVPFVVGANGTTKDGEVTTDANGKGEGASSGDWVIGKSVDTYTSGALGTLEITGLYVKA